MNDYLKAQVENYCESVKRGCKPMALFPTQWKYFREIAIIVTSHGLHYYLDCLAEGWITIYVFRNTALVKVIKDMPKKPKTVAEHTFVGLLLGYDIDSICEYLENKTLI